MNKLLLSTICAAAVTSSASAFTLDLSSLNGQTLGSGSVTNAFGTFNVSNSPSGTPISGGEINFNNGQVFTIVYPNNVTYVGALTIGGVNINDNNGTKTVTFTGLEDGAKVAAVQFDAVPEPSSTALLGLGGLALILRRRK